MNRLNSTVVLALACQLMISSTANAQAVPADPAKLWSVRGGLGFTADPGTFLINFEAERFMRDEVAVGLALQLGVDDDNLLVSPILFARYILDLSGSTNKIVKRTNPFVQAGLGLTHLRIKSDNMKKDGDATDFLMSFGLGVDYPLNGTIDIGSRMLINVIPGKVRGEGLYFSWEVLSIRYSW
jgi:opacity protein-like surface antigen